MGRGSPQSHRAFPESRGGLWRGAQVLHQMSCAHARWETEAARAIFARRKTLLLALVLTGAAPVVLYAADVLPERLPVLGGSKAYMPCLITPGMFFGSILVGLIAGLITGVIGAGGGYILTPALMSFGVRGIMAVGTDQFHLFAKAIMGTTIHGKLGNVNTRLAAWFVAGSLAGVTVGGSLSRAVFQYSPAASDAVISLVYVIVLGALGLYAIGDWRRLRRAGRSGASASEATTGLAKRLQRLPLRPRVRFDEQIVPGGRSIPVYPVVACGFAVGFVAAIMGVGGGFLTFPMFVYGLGVSTFTTVGTDILQMIFTTSYSSIFQYAIYGFVFYSVSIGMLLGSLVGVQIGAMVTKTVTGSQIRAFYALTILAGFANRLCALPRKLADMGFIALSRDAAVAIEWLGTAVFFGLVGTFALWTLWVFAHNVGAIRAGSTGTQAAPGAGPRWIRNARAFRAGVAGLAIFAVILGMSLLRGGDGFTGLERADRFFNRLAKNSAYSIPAARRKAAAMRGNAVDLEVHPREMADDRKLARVASANGLEAKVIGDGRVRIRGDLGVLAERAIEDAGLAFQNGYEQIEAHYGIRGPEVIYCWWVMFDGLVRRFVQEGRGDEANAAKFMTSRVLEPAYNFQGIEPMRISDNALPVSALLGLYVVLTVWYGFSVLLLFEGLGITVAGAQQKRER